MSEEKNHAFNQMPKIKDKEHFESVFLERSALQQSKIIESCIGLNDALKSRGNNLIMQRIQEVQFELNQILLSVLVPVLLISENPKEKILAKIDSYTEHIHKYQLLPMVDDILNDKENIIDALRKGLEENI